MIEDIIYKKLTTPKEEKQVPQRKNVCAAMQTEQASVAHVENIDNSYVEQCFSELVCHINTMENTRENFAFRHIYSCRKVIGKFIVFGKRVVRKLLKWYIEPICFQQTEFNNAVTPSIGRLTEISKELLTRGSQQQQIMLETSQRMDRVEESYQAIQATVAERMSTTNQRMDHVEANYQSLQTLTAESITTAKRRMDQMEAGHQTLRASTAENFAVTMRQVGQLEERQNLLDERVQKNHELILADQRRLMETCGRTDEQVGRLQQELQNVVVQSEVHGQTLQDQVSMLSQQLAELQSMLQLKTAVIQNLESDMNCVKDADPSIFRGIQQSFFDKRTTSQSGEDSIVAYITMALGIKPEDVTYLDLGANHAKELSNTYYFYQRGAHGVLVEANPDLIPELKLMRHGDVILNNCVSDVDGQQIEFYVLNGDGLSSCNKTSVDEVLSVNTALAVTKTVQIETIAVNTVMEQYFGGAPILLNVDIEGNDMEVLNAIDFKKYRPLLIVAEAIPYVPKLVVGQKNMELVEFMKEKNYVEYAFTGINSIFIDKEQIEGKVFM